MDKKLSARRLVENELYFRVPNEKVSKGFEELRKVAKDEKDKDLLKDSDPLVNFFCECADENCQKRIRMRPSEYAAFHKNSSQFTLLPGHDVPEIERIVKNNKSYIVVKKYNAPIGNGGEAYKTRLDNSTVS